MITLKKAILFSKYEGNVDRWLRDATSAEKSIFSEGDWGEMESIVDLLGIDKNGREREMPKAAEEVKTFTPMTDTDIENANFSIRTYENIAEDEYEFVISELWKSA